MNTNMSGPREIRELSFDELDLAAGGNRYEGQLFEVNLGGGVVLGGGVNGNGQCYGYCESVGMPEGYAYIKGIT